MLFFVIVNVCNEGHLSPFPSVFNFIFYFFNLNLRNNPVFNNAFDCGFFPQAKSSGLWIYWNCVQKSSRDFDSWCQSHYSKSRWQIRVLSPPTPPLLSPCCKCFSECSVCTLLSNPFSFFQKWIQSIQYRTTYWLLPHTLADWPVAHTDRGAQRSRWLVN